MTRDAGQACVQVLSGRDRPPCPPSFANATRVRALGAAPTPPFPPLPRGSRRVPPAPGQPKEGSA
jgi:hypothetical protein